MLRVLKDSFYNISSEEQAVTATSPYTGGGFLFTCRCALTHHECGGGVKKSRYGIKYIAILLSFSTRAQMYGIFVIEVENRNYLCYTKRKPQKGGSQA